MTGALSVKGRKADMPQQNIFDNETFFEGYRGIRSEGNNANELFEIPALRSLLPELEGKRILDLGCGFGGHCKMFVEAGAKWVTGIDISRRMLTVACEENRDPRIEYIHMPMEDIGSFVEAGRRYDLVVSSLALHYVKDFAGVIGNAYQLLEPQGELIFSQEHPLDTAYWSGEKWTRDEAGRKLYLNLANYGVESERESTWFVDHVKKYHRTFSTILNTVIDAGFTVEKVVEPSPTKELLAEYPQYRSLLHKPNCLLIKAKKVSRGIIPQK